MIINVIETFDRKYLLEDYVKYDIEEFTYMKTFLP